MFPEFPGVLPELPGVEPELPGSVTGAPGTEVEFPGVFEELPGALPELPGAVGELVCGFAKSGLPTSLIMSSVTFLPASGRVTALEAAGVLPEFPLPGFA